MQAPPWQSSSAPAAGSLSRTCTGTAARRMSGQEKDEVMSRFAAGEFDVLVSTTVIEVGIDVPNATVMIEDAERFGLAQPPPTARPCGAQVSIASYCALISSAGKGLTPSALECAGRDEQRICTGGERLSCAAWATSRASARSGLPDFRVAHPGRCADLGCGARGGTEALCPGSGAIRSPRIGGPSAALLARSGRRQLSCRRKETAASA